MLVWVLLWRWWLGKFDSSDQLRLKCWIGGVCVALLVGVERVGVGDLK